jgi:hypothetical protein
MKNSSNFYEVWFSFLTFLGRIRFSQWVIFILLVVIGFLVRAAFILHGYDSLNSDEVVDCEALLTKANGTTDFIFPDVFFRFPDWLTSCFYSFFARGQIQVLPFLFCVTSLLIYLSWTLVLVWRGNRLGRAAVPLLVFMALPAPCISYLGIQLSQIRPSYFYGAILILLAGQWFRKGWIAFVFGFLAVKACLDDPFSLFFIWPVLVYEWVGHWEDFFKKGSWKWIPFPMGVGIGWVLESGREPWFDKANSNYLHAGVASFSQWGWHLKMVLEAWPLYWISALPWGYAQQSQLGLFLRPAAESALWIWIPLIFWTLFGMTAIGAFLSIPKPRWEEAVLWGGPFLSFLIFFIFSRQTWDAATLRYIGFGQLVPALWLGVWASNETSIRSKKIWIVVLSFWLGFNAVFLINDLRGPTHEHPGAYIAQRLEQMGIRAGFANYWVSEPIRYFSNDQVLIVAYNHPPISRKATFAAQNSREIGLVWLKGLDRPENLPEIENQLWALNYRPGRQFDFTSEGWDVFVWRKIAAKP